jgi:exodeoxyribonuclease VII large subunit
VSRLPFDPEKMRAAERRKRPGDTDAPAPPAARTGEGDRQEAPLRVTDLATLIARAIKDGLPPTVRVRGEMSGLKRQTHWYFQLKDDDSVIGCVMFASAARSQDRSIADGDEVIVTGRVDHWAAGGRTQLYAEKIERAGAGAWQERLRKLVERAREAGYLDETRKRALPVFPRAVAVVTSRTGAALQDVLATMRQRLPAVDVLVIDVRVQGDRAAAGVAAALDRLSREHERLGVDAVILTRGGGSIEDLWAFNEWNVAEAIARCAVPVVAAIGHETDTTLAELVADQRCATPTQAAVRLSPDRDALREQTDQLGARLRGSVRRLVADERRFVDDAARGVRAALRHRLAREREALLRLGGRLDRHRPEALYARRATRIEAAGRRLRAAVAGRLAERRHAEAFDELADAVSARLAARADRLDWLTRELVLASPQAVLRRGYTMTRRGDGSLLRSSEGVGPNERIETVLADGSVWSVTGPDGGDAGGAQRRVAEPDAAPAREGASRPPVRRRKRRGRGRGEHPDQMGLF